MSVRSIEVLQGYLRRLCDEAVPSEDAVLLNRFVTANDREAFELLIARHGPMVLGTARRLVDNTHDAEDVFQAVFLSLARLAKTIHQGRALPAWLHKTTCRIAAKVRKNRVSGSHEPPPEPCENIDPGAGLVWREVCQALDEELQRLPERLRSPLLLCYLSGLTRDEAAKQLGWSLGTLKRRLEEGRKSLRIRLARRGIASVGLALTVLTPEALQAAVSQSLLDSSLTLIFSTGAAVPATIAVLVLSSATTMKGLAMKSILALLAAIAVGVGVYAGMGQADLPKKAEEKKEDVKPAQVEKVVPVDDPLPAGSALRFGTSRFRHGTRIKTLAVSPDGKMAFAANDNDRPRAFDLASGRVLYSPNWGSVEVGVFSRDSRELVIKQGHDLHIWDAATGNELRTIKCPPTNSRGELLEFTPDGKAVAVVSHDDREPRAARIQVIDFESGKTIREFSADNLSVLEFAFSPDGKRMASGGYDKDKDDYFARLWDVETGKELRRFMHGMQGYGVASLAFSPDGKTLATLGTQAGVLLRLFDVDTGKLRREFPKEDRVRPERGSVAFSPDGKTVAVACNSIRLYDVATGEERLCIDRRASDLHFTDGGKTLTAAVCGTIYRWDTATGKSLIPEGADSTVTQILVTADGSRVITYGQYSEAHVWDGANGKHLRQLQVGWQSSLALSPDGRFLAWPVSDESVQYTDPQTPNITYYGSRIRLYDIAADKFVDRFPAFKGDAQDLAFTTDGKKLVTSDGHASKVRIWDFAAGKEERSFQVVTAALKKKSFRVSRTRLSPDGMTVVVTYVEHSDIDRFGLAGPPHELRLWDVATGKELRRLNGGYPIDGAFSPDGRLVVTGGENSVCEIATGKRVAALPDDPLLSIRAAAFSRDGRYLAIAVPDGVIQIWEVASWTKQDEFKGYRDQSITLTFGPGGRLFTGNRDTTVLAWDVRPPLPAMKVPLEAAWTDLGKHESADACEAEGSFLAAAPAAVKFFADKIKPEAPLDPKQVQRLLADLDSDQYAERERASKALGALGHQVKPYLEEAIKTAKSTEVHDRASKILAALQAAPAAPQELRQLRAVLVLELIGDDESKNLLNKWANGPAAALLTEEASAALKRLYGSAR